MPATAGVPVTFRIAIYDYDTYIKKYVSDIFYLFQSVDAGTPSAVTPTLATPDTTKG